MYFRTNPNLKVVEDTKAEIAVGDTKAETAVEVTKAETAVVDTKAETVAAVVAVEEAAEVAEAVGKVIGVVLTLGKFLRSFVGYL